MDNHSIEEWKKMVAEIQSNSKSVDSALALIVTSATGIIGISAKLGEGLNYFAFFLPFIIIIPATYFIYSQLNSTARIASYIKVFHESRESGILWESRLSLLRSTPAEASKSRFSISLLGMIGGVSSICLLGACYQIFVVAQKVFDNDNTSMSIAYLISLILIAGIVVFLLHKGLINIHNAKRHYAKSYYHKWLVIREKEMNQESGEGPAD